MADEPEAPDADRRDQLLGMLAELISRGGPAALLAPPVVPGPEAFPEPWQPTRGGAAALLRRLAWHAGLARDIVVIDERRGAPPTERKPQTHLELTEVRKQALALTLSFIGEDDVVGTFAHEIGVAHAVLAGSDPADPYRVAERAVLEVDPDRDLERGSIATVYLGLGVVAANAAYQQYSRGGRFQGGYVPLEYDVVQAGYVPMSELAYLLAVQAAIRGETTAPRGLSPPQRDEVTAWLAVLGDRRAELRDRLGIAVDAEGAATRPAAEVFEDVEVDDPAPSRRRAFRWRGHRGFYGFALGMIGLLVAVFALGAVTSLSQPIRSWIIAFAIAGPIIGHLIGRRIQIARCSACATVVAVDAERCRKCGAELRGDITSLSQRLEAEERLDGTERGD